ncbi:hypothetical protein KL930_002643 [Ogataea haglerorum]|nr:hypothetical protein KL947_002051 [Ogataea haglerorum]KAG7778556.1 hypothetical protein KL930_002643 [Ogataea haglerorum]KAG7779242.1 hypothetical protein KL922_001727 [Ogataea haglerorum]
MIRSCLPAIRRYSTSPIQRPSTAYFQQMGQQPNPSQKEGESKEESELKKTLTRRSLRMTIWQMFLITLAGSSVLNIMREKNHIEEMDDNYQQRFKKFEHIIAELKKGNMRVEDVESELAVLNERFEYFGLPKSEFTGVRGTKKRAQQSKEDVEVKSFL